MINVNQITSQLARMPDQALQQYAQMHKNDPYTVSLALAESNRRKEMRTGAQGQQGMAPQPKVVDQNIASMASPMPEDVGIGALPAPNMQGMADGGIVAFDVGGEVDSARLKEQLIRDSLRGPSGGLAYRRQQPESYAGLQAAMEQARQERELAEAAYQQGNLQVPYFGGSTSNTAFSAPSASPSIPTPPISSTPYSNEGRGVPAAPPTRQEAPPQPDLTRNMGAGAGAPRAPAVPEIGFADRLTKAMGTNPDNDIFAQRRADITTEDVKGRKEGIAALKADQASDMAEMFKGREERITKREGELEKSKDTNTGLAFLQAGLSMMQARGPALAAIAEGAGVGTKQYAAGIDKLKVAQEKLDEARDRMEELRQNQSSMNKREIRTEEKGIRDVVTQGQRYVLEGSEKAYGIKREDMRAAVTSDVAVSEGNKQRATALEAARITASPGMERNKMLAKQAEGQDKVRKDYITLQTKVMADLSKDPKYALEQDQNKKTAIYNNALRAALQNNPFLSSYAAGIGFNNAPASGAVRTLDED